MFKNKTIVYTSGTFDMFHFNHLRMINYARSLADILIVGVSTDELVASYKSFRNALYVSLDICRKRKMYQEMTANPLRKQYVDRSGDNVKLDLTADEPNE